MSILVPKGSRLIEFTLIVIILCIMVTFSIDPRQYHVRHEIRFSPDCANNLKQLSLALHEYHQIHGSFPPPYLVDQQRTPVHSWRVLLLPILGEADLYEEYDFNEAWNGPHNSKLADRMPTVFGCPDRQEREFRSSGRRWKSLSTNYVAIVGPHAAFHPERSRKLEEFKGHTADKLMLVEIADSNINWMEPRDFDLSLTPLVVAKVAHKKGNGLSSGQIGIHAMNVDGRIRFVPASTSPNTLEKLVTIDQR